MSVASAWEIGIKMARGTLRMEVPIPWVLDADLINSVAITMTHVLEAADLSAHHADPFDRMLIAQARAEGLVLLTPDRLLRQHDVPQIDARV